MSKPIHLYTFNCNGSVSWLYSGTRSACEKYAVSRWGHIPGFVIFTTIVDGDKVRRKYGDGLTSKP
jgi:hypothetical protein